MDDSVFHTLFDGVNIDELSLDGIQQLLNQGEENPLLEVKSPKKESGMMSVEEMDDFIEKMWSSDLGEVLPVTESSSKMNAEVSFSICF